ncbi:MAG: CDP-alcohol phosphatidyltransferase family protein [Kiloniellales bacterium]
MSRSIFALELPWDQRLARWLVAPLVATPVHPNHLTTLGLLIGLTGAVLMAQGGEFMAWGAGLFMLAAFMDHVDGELARLANKTSRFGHYYDRVCAATSYVAGFIGMGLGLRHGALGGWAILIGIAAGVSITAIFMVRTAIERRAGGSAIKQPNFLGFEIEDILYGFGPIIWLGWLAPVLTATAVGAPVFLMWSLIELRRHGAAASR